MKRATALLTLALLGACDDGPSGPEPVSDVRILANSLPVDAETLPVGETVQLSASPTDDEGRPLVGRAVAWRSVVPAVARVDSTGLVTAVGVGTTQVIATAEQAADTIQITVTDPTVLPSEIACAPGDTGLSLNLGQVVTVNAQQQPVVCLQGGTGAEYTLIPFHAAASGGRLAVEVAAGGVVPASGPPNPSLLPGGGAASLSRSLAGPRPDEAFHLRLRESEGRSLARFRGARAGGAALARSAALRAPAVDDILRLNVNSSELCENPDYRFGRVEAITEHAIIVADTANPVGGFDRDEYRAFGVTFDTLVYPVDTRNFGVPEDLDANERVLIFFTRAVNELSSPSSDEVVGGFFYGRDLYEQAGAEGCVGSNAGELFYMLVPDPNGEINENVRGKDYVAGSTVAVLAHEFQHLINFSRRLFVNDAPVNEQTWLNEGLSHIAEELVFYEAANLLPEQNIDRATALTAPIRDKFIEYQLDNFARFFSYLEAPSQSSPLANDDDLSTRGAAWAFLRYAADREALPAAQRQIWFDLVNSRTSGVANLAEVFDGSPIDWLADWTVSVYTDDAGFPVAAPYQQPSWNFRSIFPAFRDAAGRYPLEVVQLGAGEANEESFRLQAGSAAFLRFGVAAGQSAAVRTSSGGEVAPARLRVMIVRTR